MMDDNVRFNVESGRINTAEHIADILDRGREIREVQQERPIEAVEPMEETSEQDSELKLLQFYGKAIERYRNAGEQGEYKALTPTAAETRIKLLTEYWSRFQKEHMTILSTMKGIQTDRIFMDTETNYITAMEILKERTVDRKKENVIIKMPVQQADVRNTWGEFDGNIKKWPGFRDRFIAAVHENPDIPMAYKFQHLSGSMVGKAARTLGEWQLTDANHNLAWERLVQLYDKKYTFCRELLRTFMRLPQLTGQIKASDLQRMSNVTHETLRQLKAQGVPVEAWDVIVVHLLHEKLDGETSRQWELARMTEEPTVSQMLNFLDQQAASLATCNRNETVMREVRNVNKERDMKRYRNSGHLSERIPCICCNRLGHPVWECEEFYNISMHARIDAVRQWNLCPNCLKTGHGVENCYKGPCIRCPGRPMHNSLICPKKDGNQAGTGGEWTGNNKRDRNEYGGKYK